MAVNNQIIYDRFVQYKNRDKSQFNGVTGNDKKFLYRS